MENQKTELLPSKNKKLQQKQKSPLRIGQGKRLVEYYRLKKKELKNLKEQITKQGGMVERKPVELSNNYLYINGLSFVGLALGGYLLYKKFKKPEQNLIDVPPPSNVSNVSTKVDLKRDIF